MLHYGTIYQYQPPNSLKVLQCLSCEVCSAVGSRDGIVPCSPGLIQSLSKGWVCA